MRSRKSSGSFSSRGATPTPGRPFGPGIAFTDNGIVLLRWKATLHKVRHSIPQIDVGRNWNREKRCARLGNRKAGEGWQAYPLPAVCFLQNCGSWETKRKMVGEPVYGGTPTYLSVQSGNSFFPSCLVPIFCFPTLTDTMLSARIELTQSVQQRRWGTSSTT
jgi:hypothetical protein